MKKDVLSPGDHAQILGDPGSTQHAQALWVASSGSWHHSAYVPVNAPCLVVATTETLFSDGLPGHLVLVGGDAPALGWIRAERVGVLAGPPAGPVSAGTRRAWQVPAGASICTRCEQWTSYGSSCIGPCSGSSWTGVGRRDPLHDWVRLEK